MLSFLMFLIIALVALFLAVNFKYLHLIRQFDLLNLLQSLHQHLKQVM